MIGEKNWESEMSQCVEMFQKHLHILTEKYVAISKLKYSLKEETG